MRSLRVMHVLLLLLLRHPLIRMPIHCCCRSRCADTRPLAEQRFERRHGGFGRIAVSLVHDGIELQVSEDTRKNF